MDRNPTTRHFSRSLQEAYPREHAEWLHHEPSVWGGHVDKAIVVMGLVCVGLTIMLVVL